MERFMRAFEGMNERGAGAADVLDPAIELVDLGSEPLAPVRREVTINIDELRDLAEREASQLEQIDEHDLLDRVRSVDALAAGPPDRSDQPAALVEAQGRGRQTGPLPHIGDRQELAH